MKRILIVALTLCMLLTVGIFALSHDSSASFAADYALSLPDGYEFRKENSGNGLFQRQGLTVGGVLLCPYPKDAEDLRGKITSVTFAAYSDVIVDTLKNAGGKGASDGFDQMLESSLYGDCQAWLGNPGEEYQHYLYFCEDGIVSLWFDLRQVDAEAAGNIAAGFTVTDGDNA